MIKSSCLSPKKETKEMVLFGKKGAIVKEKKKKKSWNITDVKIHFHFTNDRVFV